MTNEITTTATEAPAPRVYTIPAQNEAEFDKRVAKVNARLEREGIAQRFAFSRTDLLLPSIDDEDVLEEWVTKTQTSAPTIALGDFVFVAALVGEEAGMVVHTAPGQTLVGWNRPAGDDTSCDHCNVKRDRKNLYVVRNIHTDEVVQIGSTCIELYLGVEVKGLFALEFLDGLDEIVRGYRDSGAGGELIVTVDKVIAVAWAYSDEGRKYVSVAKASEWDRPSTGSLVRGHLYGPPRREHYRGPDAAADYAADLAAYQAKAELAAATMADTALMDAIKASAATLASDTDYGQNMAIVVAGEAVRSRNIGILASLVAVYAREMNLRAERAAAPAIAKGFIGEVKERIRNFSITLRTVKYWDGDYGTTTFLVGLTTDTNHLVVWKASGCINAKAGDTLVLEAATVKAHENYKGDDQTIVTRAKVKEVVSA